MMFKQYVRAQTAWALVTTFFFAHPGNYVRADLADNCLEAGAIYTASADIPSILHKTVVSANGMDSEFLFEFPEAILDIAITPDGDFFAISLVQGIFSIIKIDMCDRTYEEVLPMMPTSVNALGYDPISGGIAILGPPLYIMNTDTYELETRGGSVTNWGGISGGDIAVDPCNGVVYASLFDHRGTYNCGAGIPNTLLITLNLQTGLIDEFIGCFTEDGEYVPSIYGLAFDSLGRLIIGGKSDVDKFVVDTATAEVSRINVEGNYTGSNGFAAVQTVDICQESPVCEFTGVSAITSDGIAICDINPQQTYCIDPTLLVDPSALNETIVQNRLEYTGGTSGKGGKGGKGKGKGGKGKGGKGKGGSSSTIVEVEEVAEVAENITTSTYQLGCCPNEINPPDYCLFSTVEGELISDGDQQGGKGGKGKGKGKGKDSRRLGSS